MLEAEDSALPLRVYDLEKLVRDQQDEITFLKSTVADLQRRLNLVDGSRGQCHEVTWLRGHGSQGQ